MISKSICTFNCRQVPKLNCHRDDAADTVSDSKHVNSHTKKYEGAVTVTLVKN